MESSVKGDPYEPETLKLLDEAEEVCIANPVATPRPIKGNRSSRTETFRPLLEPAPV